jgi:hypothetical protein
MNQILEEMCRLDGVLAAFLCGSEGEVLAAEPPAHFALATLTGVGRILAQTLGAVQTSTRRKGGNLRLDYQNGALYVRRFRAGSLCIVSLPRVNSALLNLRIDVSATQLERVLRQAHDKPNGTSVPDKVQQMREVIRDTLGEHASKVLPLLTTNGGSPDDLSSAARRVERATLLFIDQEKAGRLAQRLRGIIGNRSDWETDT